MKVTFLVRSLATAAGTEAAVSNQANGLVRLGHEVEILSILRTAPEVHFPLHPAVQVRWLVEGTDPDAPRLLEAQPHGADQAALHQQPSLLVPPRWDRQISALCDLALAHALPSLRSDVMVTVSPGYLQAAAELLPEQVALVHQEHRASIFRGTTREALLAFGPRADLLAVLTEDSAAWLRAQLGPMAPPVVAVPNARPPGFRPRSELDRPLILAAGRLRREKRFTHLVRAFASVSGDLPGWRLRIFGKGPARGDLLGLSRRLGLHDRLELPGTSADMASEWAKASIAALSSKAEGHPLVLLEAMAAGVPVVAYDCPTGPAEIIEHERTGFLVPPASEQGLAEALLKLGTDERLRRSMGTAALAASARFDPVRVAETWAQLYADVCRRQRHRSLTRVVRRHLELAERSDEPGPVEAPTAGGEVIARTTPDQARSRALACVAGTARSVSRHWVVIPSHAGSAPLVVLPAEAREEFLRQLPDAAPSWLTMRRADEDWPERRGSVPEMCAHLRGGRTNRVWLEPWPEADGRPTHLAHGCGVRVEFWSQRSGALWADHGNDWTMRLPLDAPRTVVKVHGVEVPTLPQLTVPTPGECLFPVDAVYTWVDDADPPWQQARARRAGTEQVVDPSAVGAARFRNRDELRYSLRSVFLFAPWIRRIHLVTAGQVPDWLDTTDPRIRLVDHRDILPASALPTFNSHAIETGLHRIDGLSEQYLYFNDDVFLGRPLQQERFFGPDGRPAVFLDRRPLGLEEDPEAMWHRAALNNRALLERDHGRRILHPLAHTPHPQRRSVVADLERRYAAEFRDTAQAPFRSPGDIAVPSSLAPHHGLITGAAYLGELEWTGVRLGSEGLRRQLDRLLEREHDSFFLIDYHDAALPPARIDDLLAGALERYFPVPGPWERRPDPAQA